MSTDQLVDHLGTQQLDLSFWDVTPWKFHSCEIAIAVLDSSTYYAFASNGVGFKQVANLCLARLLRS